MSEENKNRPLGEILQSAIACHHDKAPGSIGDLLHFEVLSYDENAGTFLFRCRTESWMSNLAGTLHGGMSAAIADQAMGLAAFALRPDAAFTPTIQMQTEYLYPLFPGKEILVRVCETGMSGTMVHLRAELSHANREERVCVIATGIYYLQMKSKNK